MLKTRKNGAQGANIKTISHRFFNRARTIEQL